MRKLETVDKEIEKLHKKREGLAEDMQQVSEDIESATDERDDIIEAGFSDELKNEAKELNINVRNFDTEEELEQAIELRKKEEAGN